MTGPRTLLDQYDLLWARRRLGAKIVGASVLLAVVVSLVLPSKYEARTTLSSLKSGTPGFGAIFGDTAFAPALSGLAKDLVGGDNDRLFSILESYALSERVVKRLDLMKAIFHGEWDAKAGRWEDPEDAPTMPRAVDVMQRKVLRVEEDERGLITVTVRWWDPATAAAIADAYAEELQAFIDAGAFSIAKKNLVFLRGRLAQNRKDLDAAEEALRGFQEKHKIVALDVQTEQTMQAIADLQAKIISKNVEIGMLERFATPSNPRLALLRSEVDELGKQTQQLSLGYGAGGAPPHGAPKPGDLLVGVENAPSLALALVRLKREALVQEKVFAFLNQQVQLAQIEEHSSEISFQVVDRAVPPAEPYRPKPLLNVAVAVLVAAFAFVILVLLQDGIARLREERAARLPAPAPPSGRA
jgi:uncharacterized protein involved in exopolysaccharide biosynthesis